MNNIGRSPEGVRDGPPSNCITWLKLEQRARNAHAIFFERQDEAMFRAFCHHSDLDIAAMQKPCASALICCKTQRSAVFRHSCKEK